MLAVIVGLNRKGGSFAPLVLMLAFFATLIGPYMVRNDLRMDLPRLPVLKTWPITGRELLVGELLAPWVVLSIVVWFLLALAFALSPAWSAGPGDIARPRGRRPGGRDPRADADRGAVDRAERGGRAVSRLGGDGRRARARRRGDGAEHPDVRRDAPVAGDRRAAGRWRWRAASGGCFYLLVGWPGALPAAVVFAGILLGEAVLALTWLGRVLERTEPSQVEVAE